MGFFWKKEQSIIDKIGLYLHQINTAQDLFRRSMEELIMTEWDGKSEESVELVHRAESRADDLRRAIELELYRKALIPESRGDVLGLLESIDKIPGMFESLCYQMSLQKILIPKDFRERFLQLIDVNLAAWELLKEAVLGLFYSRDVKENIDEIDNKESESDRVERGLIKDIFECSLDKADKILLKEIVVNIGNISDLAQATTDRLNLAIVKRRI